MTYNRPVLTEPRQCPLWVISRHCAVSGRCPLYPQKQTSELSRGMSALCQKRTWDQFAWVPLIVSCRLTNRAAHGPCSRNQGNGAVTFYWEIRTYAVTHSRTAAK